MIANARWSLVVQGEELTGPIRPLDRTNEREVNRVRKTWIRTAKDKPNKSHFPTMADRLGATDYWEGAVEARERLLLRNEVRIASTESGATVLGWACLSPRDALVHYIWIDPDLRRRGLARQLLSDMVGKAVYCTWWTYDAAACKLPEGWKFSAWRNVG